MIYHMNPIYNKPILTTKSGNNNKKLAKEEEIEDELMTETCYDINKKRVFNN